MSEPELIPLTRTRSCKVTATAMRDAPEVIEMLQQREAKRLIRWAEERMLPIESVDFHRTELDVFEKLRTVLVELRTRVTPRRNVELKIEDARNVLSSLYDRRRGRWWAVQPWRIRTAWRAHKAFEREADAAAMKLAELESELREMDSMRHD